MGKLVETIRCGFKRKKPPEWFSNVCNAQREAEGPMDIFDKSQVSLEEWVNNLNVGVTVEATVTRTKKLQRRSGVDYKFIFESEAAKTMFLLKYA